MPNRSVTSLAALHSALGSVTRMGIIAVLHSKPTSVTGLAEAVGVSVTAISQQLQKMRSAGLVESTRNAQTIIYRLSRPVDPVVQTSLALLTGKRPSIDVWVESESTVREEK